MTFKFTVSISIGTLLRNEEVMTILWTLLKCISVFYWILFGPNIFMFPGVLQCLFGVIIV